MLVPSHLIAMHLGCERRHHQSVSTATSVLNTFRGLTERSSSLYCYRIWIGKHILVDYQLPLTYRSQRKELASLCGYCELINGFPNRLSSHDLTSMQAIASLITLGTS